MLLDDLEQKIAQEAIKKGWAEDKVKFSARVLRILIKDVKDKELRCKFREVIKFCEEYEFDE